MPIIRIEMFEGRDRDLKGTIISEVTGGFCRATGASPESDIVIITDVSPDEWGRGGIAFADRDKS